MTPEGAMTSGEREPSDEELLKAIFPDERTLSERIKFMSGELFPYPEVAALEASEARWRGLAEQLGAALIYNRRDYGKWLDCFACGESVDAEVYENLPFPHAKDCPVAALDAARKGEGT